MLRSVRRVVVPLALAATLVPSGASATDRVIPARLAWVRDDSAQSCPDALQMEARLRTRLDADPFQGSPHRLIEAIVRRADGTFTTHISVRGLDGSLLGTRDLTSASADCGGLANAAVVAMAMSLTIGDEAVDDDPQGSSSSGAPDPASSSAPPGPDSSAAPNEVAPRARTSSPLPVPLVLELERPPVVRPPGFATSVSASANGFFHAGILPLVGAGVGLQFDARLHRYARVGLGLAWFPDQTLRTTDSRFDFGMTVGHVDLCIDLLGTSPHTFALCAAVWLGGIHAVVYDLEPAAPGLTPWFGASNTARVSFQLVGPLEAEFEAGAMLDITRYHFVRTDGNDVFVQSPVGFIGRAGLGVRFR